MTEGTDTSRRPRGLFISYRRGDTSGQARALHDQLAERFGSERVFMDVDSIAPGADFVQKIDEAIDSSGVVLVLIGSDWLGSGGHSLDDTDDFVRLEVDTAIRQSVHTIPILVERTRMPNPAELPESLRPLTKRNALDLENGRWEYDVARLMKAVEPFVDQGSIGSVPTIGDVSSGRTEVDERKQGPRLRRRALALVVAGIISLAVVIILVLLPSRQPKEHMRLVSAAGTVSGVPPDRLVEALLSSGFTSPYLPRDASASNPVLTSYQAGGLTANVYVPISGPAVDIGVSYLIFDTQGDASSYFVVSNPAPNGYRLTDHFTAPGIGDSVKCTDAHLAAKSSQGAQWLSGCATLSGDVVTYVHLSSYTKSRTTDEKLATTLIGGAVKQLRSVASTTSRTLLTPPPGSLSPNAQYEQILTSTFSAKLLPQGFSSPSVQQDNVGSNGPPGLLSNSGILVTFNGPDYQDDIEFFVFSSAQDAETWFSPPPGPTGATQTGTIDSSGFSQQSQCVDYERPADGTTPRLGISQCDILWGNVVTISDTSSTSDTRAGSNDLAVTLARVGVTYLGQVDGS